MSGLRRAAAPLLGAALALVLLAATRGLDEVVRAGQLGPGLWPRMVLAGLAITCAARLVGALLIGRGRVSKAAAPLSGAEADRLSPGARTKLVAAIALILLYVLVTPPAGFALTTAVFILAFMWLCGTRSTWALGANALVGTVALLYLFVKLVYLPLPKGDGLFETATLALYRALHIL